MANKTLSGAEVIIECLKREGVDTIFGYPGGSAIPMFDAILDSSIKVVLSRHEQGATHMADGSMPSSTPASKLCSAVMNRAQPTWLTVMPARPVRSV